VRRGGGGRPGSGAGAAARRLRGAQRVLAARRRRTVQRAAARALPSAPDATPRPPQAFAAEQPELLRRRLLDLEAGTTPLHRAVAADQLEVVRLLAAAGVSMELLDARGRTPLQVGGPGAGSAGCWWLLGPGREAGPPSCRMRGFWRAAALVPRPLDHPPPLNHLSLPPPAPLSWRARWSTATLRRCCCSAARWTRTKTSGA
jgi:hypothetical protein